MAKWRTTMEIEKQKEYRIDNIPVRINGTIKKSVGHLHRQYNCFCNQIFIQLSCMAHMLGEITITALILIL